MQLPAQVHVGVGLRERQSLAEHRNRDVPVAVQHLMHEPHIEERLRHARRVADLTADCECTLEQLQFGTGAYRPPLLARQQQRRAPCERELWWRRSGSGLAQVVVVDQHLDGQAVVGGLPTIEGHGRHVADLMAVLPGQPAQVSGAAAAGIDPRWRRHDRAAVAGHKEQLALRAAQDLIVTVMDPAMVGTAEAEGIGQVGGAAQLPGQEVVEVGPPSRHPAAGEAAGAIAGLQGPALGW